MSRVIEPKNYHKISHYYKKSLNKFTYTQNAIYFSNEALTNRFVIKSAGRKKVLLSINKSDLSYYSKK
jgi:hypothetical protein